MNNEWTWGRSTWRTMRHCDVPVKLLLGDLEFQEAGVYWVMCK